MLLIIDVGLLLKYNALKKYVILIVIALWMPKYINVIHWYISEFGSEDIHTLPDGISFISSVSIYISQVFCSMELIPIYAKDKVCL